MSGESRPDLRLAARIKQLIADSPYTYREIGRRLGVDHALIRKWASGAVDPRLGGVARLLDALGLRWSALDDEGTHGS